MDSPDVSGRSSLYAGPAGASSEKRQPLCNKNGIQGQFKAVERLEVMAYLASEMRYFRAAEAFHSAHKYQR